MKTCLACGSPSGNCKFCSKCAAERHKASALVSQNSKKLKWLLRTKRITTTWFEKFLLYTENIRNNWRVLMKYKTIDELRNLIVVNHYGCK